MNKYVNVMFKIILCDVAWRSCCQYRVFCYVLPNIVSFLNDSNEPDESMKTLQSAV